MFFVWLYLFKNVYVGQCESVKVWMWLKRECSSQAKPFVNCTGRGKCHSKNSITFHSRVHITFLELNSIFSGFLCNGIRWPLFILFISQLTVLVNYLCALDTTLRNTELMIQITCYEIIWCIISTKWSRAPQIVIPWIYSCQLNNTTFQCQMAPRVLSHHDCINHCL